MTAYDQVLYKRVCMSIMEGGGNMLPEERAREKIDKQLKNAGWDIVSRDKEKNM